MDDNDTVGSKERIAGRTWHRILQSAIAYELWLAWLLNNGWLCKRIVVGYANEEQNKQYEIMSLHYAFTSL